MVARDIRIILKKSDEQSNKVAAKECRWSLPLHSSTPALSPAVKSSRWHAAGRKPMIPSSLRESSITTTKPHKIRGPVQPHGSHTPGPPLMVVLVADLETVHDVDVRITVSVPVAESSTLERRLAVLRVKPFLATLGSSVSCSLKTYNSNSWMCIDTCMWIHCSIRWHHMLKRNHKVNKWSTKNNSKFKIQIVVLQLTGGGEEDVTSGLEFFASSLFPMEKQTPFPDSKMIYGIGSLNKETHTWKHRGQGADLAVQFITMLASCRYTCCTFMKHTFNAYEHYKYGSVDDYTWSFQIQSARQQNLANESTITWLTWRQPHDILRIQISTRASNSTFSISRRVLTDYVLTCPRWHIKQSKRCDHFFMRVEGVQGFSGLERRRKKKRKRDGEPAPRKKQRRKKHWRVLSLSGSARYRHSTLRVQKDGRLQRSEKERARENKRKETLPCSFLSVELHTKHHDSVERDGVPKASTVWRGYSPQNLQGVVCPYRLA
ncbi:hypothetical protein LXL04_010764 [Taraxacum kok-saghyz]